VDVADVAAAGAVRDRQPERAGVRRPVVREGGDAGGTPAMWFIAVPILVWALWRTFVKRDWRYAAILVGYSAGFLPWFADIDRQMYFFYAATMAPFLVLAIAMILGDILYKPNQNSERRTLGLIAVSCYVALVLTNFAWMYPILTGIPISQATWNMQIWLPSWS
jgi:dolichyl-phosphate-mannose-protein mannosyltransferase